jgi:hypothetical protein
MTEPEKPAPTKKRVFFKKAAWQTKKDPEETERDIFSHSNEYAAILAEENKRKEEQRRREEGGRRRRSQEKHSRKRRRISSEQEDAQGADRKPVIETQVGETESKEYAPNHFTSSDPDC